MKIGVLGAGQLAKMLALAAYSLGFSVRTFSPDVESCCDGITERVRGDFTDSIALNKFAAGLDVVTFEFENIPLSLLEKISVDIPLFPSQRSLSISCDRIEEKNYLNSLEIPTAKFRRVDSLADLDLAAQELGLPLILKTRTLGYDGRGQRTVYSQDEFDSALAALGSNLIAEERITFDRELSVIGVRSSKGEIALYPLFLNLHSSGILAETVFPAPLASPQLTAQAHAYMGKILSNLSYVGVCTLELFEKDGSLVANEIAPRVHNSGHVTIEGASTSQFENHVRALSGLPLGSTAPRGTATMLNLIGSRPDADALLRLIGTHFHWYGKAVRPGRKVGHITVTELESLSAARALVTSIL